MSKVVSVDCEVCGNPYYCIVDTVLKEVRICPDCEEE